MKVKGIKEDEDVSCVLTCRGREQGKEGGSKGRREGEHFASSYILNAYYLHLPFSVHLSMV